MNLELNVSVVPAESVKRGDVVCVHMERPLPKLVHEQIIHALTVTFPDSKILMMPPGVSLSTKEEE